jgi:hypothetical protein
VSVKGVKMEQNPEAVPIIGCVHHNVEIGNRMAKE